MIRTIGDLLYKLRNYSLNSPIKIFSSVLCDPEHPEEGTDDIEVHDLQNITDGWDHSPEIPHKPVTIEIHRSGEPYYRPGTEWRFARGEMRADVWRHFLAFGLGIQDDNLDSIEEVKIYVQLDSVLRRTPK
jgi:hypothetical protein